MATTIKIPKGNDFNLFFPLSLMQEHGNVPLPADMLTDIHVTIAKGTFLTEYPYTVYESSLVVAFPETLERATYDVHVTAKYEGRDIASHLKACFSIVDWNRDANMANYFPKRDFTADTSVFIGLLSSDADVESVKQEYLRKINDLAKAKDEYEHAKDNFSAEALSKMITEAKDEIIKAIENDSSDMDEVTNEDIDNLFTNE